MQKYVFFWLRYPYWSPAYVKSEHPLLRAFGIIYGASVLLSWVFVVYLIVGTPSIYRLKTPEAVVLPYIRNETNQFEVKMRSVQVPNYCTQGWMKEFNADLYPEAMETMLFADKPKVSRCEEFTEVGAFVEKTPSGLFVRTVRVLHELSTTKTEVIYTKYPEQLTFGIKHKESLSSVEAGIMTWKHGEEDTHSYGKCEWQSLQELFPGLSLDAINMDNFYGADVDLTSTATYRQTGVVVGLFIEYYNFPRSLKELGLGFDLRAEIKPRVMTGMRGLSSPKQIIDVDTGRTTSVVYDYGVHINIIKTGFVGTVEWNLIFACCSSAFIFLYVIGAVLDFASVKHGTKQKRGQPCALDQVHIDGVSAKPSGAIGNELFDESIYQPPYIRELYDDSTHDIERSMRARNRSAFGPKQDFMLASHSLQRALIPTSVHKIATKNILSAPVSIDPMKSEDTSLRDLNPNECHHYACELTILYEKIFRLHSSLNDMRAQQKEFSKRLSQNFEKRVSRFSRLSNPEAI